MYESFMTTCKVFSIIFYGYFLLGSGSVEAQQITTAKGKPAELDIRPAGKHAVRVTLKPIRFKKEFPANPALGKHKYPKPVIRLREIHKVVTKQVGNLHASVRPDPLRVKVVNGKGELVQKVTFQKDGTLSFRLDHWPVLGMGEGGPKSGKNVDWRKRPVEFDRRGRLFQMRPRWQSGAYGSRNPVPLLVGTRGWALFMSSPWVKVDLSSKNQGIFIPEKSHKQYRQQSKKEQHLSEGEGKPPYDSIVPGLYDFFIFDAHQPRKFMKNISALTGQAVMPPKWALGYMQSHRTLRSAQQMINIVNTFRDKRIPLDAVAYLGTGFCPRGWNKSQPSFQFNPQVFQHHTPKETIADLHARHVKVVLHMVPPDRNKLPSLHGNIPPKPGEKVNKSDIKSYWQQHVPAVKKGVDSWWPDEGDWFNLFERMERHKMYYQGPISTQPNTRPWSFERNGYLGIAKWGGWMWSGDTQSSWKTLQAQVAVGLNYSLSLAPFWGSDIGGFFPNKELTGELYARWFQFGAFSPLFRAHGQTWWTRLPWGWGLSTMGPLENGPNEPLVSQLNNPRIEPIAKKYDNLRYQLLAYNYTLAWDARSKGMPMMRALWLQYPDDKKAAGIGDEYLWGDDMLIAPVYTKGATSRKIYLPKGEWYDWWTNQKLSGGKTVTRKVDLSTMPIYVPAGAIIPINMVRQYVYQKVKKPTTLRIYPGADGAFTLYNDDGESLDYLDGTFSKIRFIWHDHARTLILKPIGNSKGNFFKNKKFRIKLATTPLEKTITYTNKRREVKMK